LAQLDTPILVFMAGLPGSGKTTLALALSRKLRWQLVDKDWNKFTLMTMDVGLIEEKLAKLAYELAFATVKDVLIRQNSSAILDTVGLYIFVFDEARRIVENAKAQLKIILYIADRKLRNHRLRNMPDHIPSTRVDPATIADYLRFFDHLPQDMLVLDTSNPLNLCVDKSIEFLSVKIPEQ
jgi:cytidylate kinase